MRYIVAIAMRGNAAARKKMGNADAIAGNMKPATRSYPVSR